MKHHKNLKLIDRLHALAAFVPTFEASGFQFGSWEKLAGEPGGVTVSGGFGYSAPASEFVRVCYENGWVLENFDWPGWMKSVEAIHLRDDPDGLENASPDDLARLLTVFIRQDRFVEGGLGAAFEAGFLTRIVRRCSVLERQLLS